MSQLALASGEHDEQDQREAERDASAAIYGVVAMGVALVVVLGAMLGAWASLRASTPVWPPKGFSFDEYFGNMLSVTILMAALAGWWGVYGVVKNDRRQAACGFGLCAFLDGAFINLATYALRSSKLSPSQNGFGVLYYALHGTSIAIAGSGLLVAAVVAARVLGGHNAKGIGWAAGWYGTFVMVAWGAAYTAMYVVQ